MESECGTMRFKRVVLVNPYPYYAAGINEATIYPPLGIAYIAAVLRNHSVECKIIDANVLGLSTEEILGQIVRFKPDLVGISLSLFTVRAGKELCAAIAELPDIKVCFGGVYASSHFESLLQSTKADYVITGEGEFSLLELCEGKAISGVDGLAYVTADNLVVHKPRALIDDLDCLPLPAYDLLPPFSAYKSRIRRSPMAAIITSRGCPFNCSYCNSNVFGKKFRARSPESVISEIELLVREFKVRQIDVLDDNFTLHIPRAERILDLIIEKKFDIAINLQNGVRADRVTLPLVKKMKKAGVFKVGFGVESGNRGVLEKIVKGLDLKKVKIANTWFKNERISTSAFFMVGLPYDTEATVEETIQFALDLDPDIANFSIFVPLPETKIFDELRAAGLIDLDLYEEGLSSGFLGREVYYRNVNLSRGKIGELHAKAYRRFNLRPRKMISTLGGIRSIAELKWFAAAALPVLNEVVGDLLGFR
jgi:radical SAM superfamily enzyme YgiQ (UPF0313 family)